MPTPPQRYFSLNYEHLLLRWRLVKVSFFTDNPPEVMVQVFAVHTATDRTQPISPAQPHNPHPLYHAYPSSYRHCLSPLCLTCQVAEFPPMRAARRRDWGWELSNSYVTFISSKWNTNEAPIQSDLGSGTPG